MSNSIENEYLRKPVEDVASVKDFTSTQGLLLKDSRGGVKNLNEILNLPSADFEKFQDELNSLTQDTAENIVENLIGKKIPYGELIVIASKVAYVLYQALGKGIQTARVRTKIDETARQAANMAFEVTEKSIEALKISRAWQNEGIEEFKKISREICSATITVLLENAVEKIVGKLVGHQIKKIAYKVGDFIGDLLTGDYIKSIKFIKQPMEDTIEKITGWTLDLLFMAFVEAISVRAVVAGKKEEVESALTNEQIPTRLRELTPEAKAEILRQIKFSNELYRLGNDLDRGYLQCENEYLEGRGKLRAMILEKYPEFRVAGELGEMQNWDHLPEYKDEEPKLSLILERKKQELRIEYGKKKSELIKKWDVPSF
jgi:hypothetical protein